MVQRKLTGWEHLAGDPVTFFERVLLLQVSNEHKAWMRAVADGRRDRMGLVWNPSSGFEADEASIACGMAFWAAACQHRPTVIWGGRRSVARAWIDHAAAILSNSTGEFRNGHRLSVQDDKPIGLMLPNGGWVLRFDGAMRDDPMAAVHALGHRANVLIGDFSWTDRETVQHALDYAHGYSALTLPIIVHGRN